MRVAGLKKWIPKNRAGEVKALEMEAIDKEEVLEAKIQ
jgi:hypothetical protein